MNNFNFSVLEGNLVRDPELSYVKGDRAVCRFTIGNNRSYTNKDGEKVDQSQFFEVTAWSKLAEVCNRYLRKGSHVLVSGVLKRDNWKTKEGENRFKVYLESREVNFLPNGKKSDQVPVEQLAF